MTPVALGIDVGTSGIRAAALDPDGGLVAAGQATMAEAGTDPCNPATWAAALRLSLNRLADRMPLSRIGAVCVDGTSGTVLGLDAAGDPVGRALMYNDTVDDLEIVTAIMAHAPQQSAARSASSALARALQLQGRSGVARILHQADWVASLLTDGVLPSDESNALKTGYDPVARCWPDWIGTTGMRRALLPEVVPAGTVFGQTSGALGLPQGVPLVAGLTDGCASFLATGADAPGHGVTALGTTLTIKVLSEAPIVAPTYGIYSHRIGDMWLAGGASNSGGAVLLQHFTPDQITTLSAQIDPDRDSGLDYYPLPKAGERFPINDPDLAPRLDPRPTDRVAFLHGLLDGVARIETLGYQRLRELGAPAMTGLYTVGGGAKNAVWTRMRARLTGATVKHSLSTQASEGAARLALPHLP
ncbi:FGGY-family carbohydrate kinase [Actibacterium sp. 188UL27-1]|uniref:FGGY-family carbohydrate kinase n=1 Tax=Actibacterium sp. 188UL27-1 TaxID=2786961 RepID=UPI00195A296F|nr:FGGY-family carbohydrate kinase [Actibacterium sp. 188UL27-1]MBM7069398.1 FGGY-family carbohydrate kinase [Actibacterium sp. 188UL27-1]